MASHSQCQAFDDELIRRLIELGKGTGLDGLKNAALKFSHLMLVAEL